VDLQLLLARVCSTRTSPLEASACVWSPSAAASDLGEAHYTNKSGKLGIDFQVSKLPFKGLQVMDPRLVTIAPGACNEKHRHAHESIFVLLSGQGEILIDKQAVTLEKGSIAYVPRWVVHQSRNSSIEAPLLLLAITDFGLTSAVLGDYDAKTRLKAGGADAFATGERD
jgi:quercetin dioxygenase-like cupin family protein